ncbi:MAG TPA: hypothetical protein VJ719_10100 [Chthoniobacterales bacterium]|nr:hypothetical protein [Chthoniobacterales bacterium]
MSNARVRNKISRSRTIKSLEQSLDETYRQIRDAASAEWIRLFGGTDPSDACFTVRISQPDAARELARTPRNA